MRNKLRMALVLLAGAFVPGIGHAADCAIAESPAAFTNALLARLRPMGVRDINKIGSSGSRDHYAISGAAFSLFITPSAVGMKEVGIVLSEPSTDDDMQGFLSAASFAASHIGGKPEKTVRSEISNGLRQHPSGEWGDLVGSTFAGFTTTPDGVVAKIGKVTCE